MHSPRAFFLAAALLAFDVSCREVDAPLVKRGIELAAQPRVTAGPPQPVGYTLSSLGGSGTELSLHNYPFDTWIELIPDGTTFHLTAYDNAKPVNTDVGVGGVSGGRNGCDFHTSVSFGTQNVSSFGDCGSVLGKADTALAKGQGFINRGSFPLDYQTPDLYDCESWRDACHIQEDKNMNFTVRVIPVTMKQVKASPHAVNFNAPGFVYQQVTFTTGPIPDSLTVGGSRRAMPFNTTSWVYTGADGTLDGNMCNGGFPILTCSPFLHKSGRLVVKAFTGGWEQTSTVTVQCLVSPADSLLNDSTGDFGFRETLLEALAESNADSAAGVGLTAEHRGYRHETGGRIYRWHTGPNVGKYFFSPVNDPNATECHIDTHYGEENETYLGAEVVGHYHVHAVTPPDSVYGCLPDSETGQKFSQYPGDGLEPVRALPQDSTKDNYGLGGGSLSDWTLSLAQPVGHYDYVLWKDGTVYRLGHGPSANIENNPSYWAAFGAARDPGKPAGKCGWLRKFTPT